MTTDHHHRLVGSLEERFRALETGFHEAYWRSQVDVGPANDRRRERLELELRRAKGDPEALAGVSESLEAGVHDPVLERQLQVLKLSLTGNQMVDEARERLVELSTSVESDFAAFRPEVDGRRLTDNQIEEILKTSDDESLRRRAWEASKGVGKVVAERVRELARVRNDVARDLGYADYYTMGLDLQELSEPWLFDVLDRLERLTESPFRAWKAELDSRLGERFGTSAPAPWHYADPFFQTLPPDGRVNLDRSFADVSAPELAVRTFKRWGIDLTGVMGASDLYPRERKSQHAFCIHIDRCTDDVRILANVVPGERWIEVMLHESGHAAYDLALGSDLPYLLRRPAHIFVTEAIALLSGRLARDPRWLRELAGRPAPEIDELRHHLVGATRAQNLVFARWALVVVHFERALYSDPEADLDALWWELVARFQLVEAPPARRSPDWAAKIHVAGAPVYYQNYLLGDLLASQLAETCERECGGLVGVEEAGRLLIERVFQHGALLRWDALVEEATGSKLSPEAFARELGESAAPV